MIDISIVLGVDDCDTDISFVLLMTVEIDDGCGLVKKRADNP